MSRLSDRLSELEAALDRNDGDDESAFLGRRMAFRQVLAEWGDDCRREGYAEGQRDVWESQHRAQRAAEKNEAAATAGED